MLAGRPNVHELRSVDDAARRGTLMGVLLVGRPRELPGWRRRLAGAEQPERKAA
jgi:hypothetical protein